MSKQEIIVGIDLGTTNSEIAVIRGGRVEMIPVEPDRYILPSVVGFGEDGSLLVGAAARNQAALHPERTVRSVKRRMGEATKLAVAGKDYTPQEISAMILRQLKNLAERYLGEAVAKAVITVPAFFSDAQRQATREAGAIAGLEVVRIINEPTAAALAYESGHQGARKVLVYDLGGGTFDVSVVNLEQDVVEVLASHGNNHLGGDDFDHRLVDHILGHLREQQGVAGELPAAALARIRRAAEAAKIALSDQPYATVSEEYLLEQKGEPVHLSLEISREDYEGMIHHYVEETLAAAHIALEGAKLTASEMEEVLLVGGATRTPLIARRLEEEFGLQPRGDVEPDLCVAMGAAIQAGIVAGLDTPTVLVDVTPYTFGTSVISYRNGEQYPYCYYPLIRKNTPIPVSKSEVFYTAVDGQEKVNVEVYQGEDADALNNIEIGEFLVEGLRDVPAGNPIVIRFALDLNGILEVTAREKVSGKEHSVTIRNALSQFETDDVETARQRIGTLFHQPEVGEEASERRLAVEAKALVEKAERLMDGAGADDREDLVDRVETVKDALAAEDEDALQGAVNELADLIYYLES
jgi:molecular chaperone DnaK (HSP70)